MGRAILGLRGGANFLPTEHIALYNACAVQGDFAKGRRIMSALMPLMQVLEQGGKVIQTIKYGVTLAGIDTGAVYGGRLTAIRLPDETLFQV